ncbi:MAG: hypothetical protein E7435_05065 [Ruminococcaceae bacterium]|nr:hypothetical protein [Oscillospiraceae bacterium]
MIERTNFDKIGTGLASLNLICEVVIIGRRILILLFAFILSAYCLLPMRAEAATSDSKAGVVSVSSGYLNVRRSASTSSSVVLRLSKGSYITLLSKIGNWWYVEYGQGQYGYCHSSYIKVADSSTASVATNNSPLNVRSGAGTSYKRIGSLARGTKIVVLSSSGSWSKVLYNGTKTGYVSKQYLSFNDSYSAVSLSVPYFQQTDSRWSWVTLGNSGQTMGKIGCTTTALAMSESYRRGKTIYPDTMAKSLSYTSSGSLYWPSNYIGVTAGLNLEAIYKYLRDGKPVIVGFTNRSGGQHWAVIYGYTGGSNLQAGGFLIHDPGVRSRTTLSDLIEDYPYFGKYVYYQ